jgi:hypothetical protein
MRLPAKLLFLLLFASVEFASALGPYIEGRVVNSATNEPVPNADLSLTCVKLSKYDRMCRDVTAKTGPDGTFSVDRLYRVKYLLTATGAPGLVETRQSQIEADLHVAPSLTEVVLKLEPEAIIGGKVEDADGKPAPDIEVVAFKQVASGSTSHLSLTSRAVSNNSGEYVFHKLAPGNYYVATVIKTPNTLEPQDKKRPFDTFLLYSPSALSLEDAIATHLEPGRTVSEVDLHLRPVITYRIAGRAQMEIPDQAISGDLELHIYPRDNSGVTGDGREILLNPDGSFQANVPAGLYTLKLTGTTTINPPPGSKTPPAMMLHLLAKQDIEISGKGVYGILILIPPPSVITGRVYLSEAGQDKIEKGDVMLRPVEPTGASGCQSAETQPDGTFRITNCDVAAYAVKFSPPAGTYVKEITFNAQDALTHPIDLSHCSGGELKIVIRPGAAAVTATIKDSDSNKSFDVFLIPDTWAENELIPVVHAIGKDGKYSALGLTPGRYSALAANGIDPHLWENAKFIQQVKARGAECDLAENEQRQLVIPQLTEAEITQIELQLGLY